MMCVMQLDIACGVFEQGERSSGGLGFQRLLEPHALTDECGYHVSTTGIAHGRHFVDAATRLHLREVEGVK